MWDMRKMLLFRGAVFVKNRSIFTYCIWHIMCELISKEIGLQECRDIVISAAIKWIVLFATCQSKYFKICSFSWYTPHRNLVRLLAQCHTNIVGWYPTLSPVLTFLTNPSPQSLLSVIEKAGATLQGHGFLVSFLNDLFWLCLFAPRSLCWSLGKRSVFLSYFQCILLSL